MPYSMIPRDVRPVVEAVIAGRDHAAAQFLYYHLNRNHFNVGREVTTLRRTGGDRFVDNLGNVWEEQSIVANYFHMPLGNWVGSNLGLTAPHSRKFLRDDTVSGLNGEFEMIIRHDGKRIDALTHEGYQETYNFGRTRNFRDHKTLDVDPHNANGNYAFRMDTGSVTITE